MIHTIAIQPDCTELAGGRRQSYSDRWIERLGATGHQVRLVDVYAGDPIGQIRGCHGFMWRFSVGPTERQFAKKLLPAVEHGLGIPVFPDWRTLWHYDDKIAQTYLLKAADIPIPRTWIFWDYQIAMEFVRRADYPLVLKLSAGASSENVQLVTSPKQARRMVRSLFGSGMFTLSQPGGQELATIQGKARAAARALLKGRPPHPGYWHDLQKNCVLFQEFLPGNQYDTRVTVVGNRAFAFRRFNRRDDFRASGSGNLDADHKEIDLAFVRLGFKAARALHTQSLAIDGLYRGEERVTAEISYTYASWAVHSCPGHWKLAGDREGGELAWVEGPMRPEDALLQDYLVEVARYRVDQGRTSAA